MLLGDFINELADRLKANAADDDVRKILRRKINAAYKEVANAGNWEHLKRISEIQSIPNYATGTISALSGRTVNGAGTGWTAALEGRYIKFGSNANWYKIIRRVSDVEITLLIAPSESPASGSAYAIWKRFYYLHSDVRKIIDFGSWQRDGELLAKSAQWLQDISKDISNEGVPDFFAVYGADQFEREYTTGTASVAKDDNLMSGTGTAWLANVEAGDEIIIGTQKLRVKRVESDDRIRMINFSGTTLSESLYRIRKDVPVGIQFYRAPDSNSYTFPYTYQKRVYDMVNDNYDRPELPEDFDWAILDGAEASRMIDISDEKYPVKLQEYAARIRDLRTTQIISTPRFRQFSPHIPTRSGY